MLSGIFSLSVLLTIVVTGCCSSATSNACSTGQVRLTGMSSSRFGRLEVCLNETWGTICSSSVGNTPSQPTKPWTLKNSAVVCNMLGYGLALQHNIHPVRLSDVRSQLPRIHHWIAQCTGHEDVLTKCETVTEEHISEVCSHEQDVVVFCGEPLEGDVRLVGSGHSDEEGIVEIYTKYHGWATICTNNWDDKDAAVVCKQLGYDNGGRHNTSSYVSYLPTKRFDHYRCSGKESSLAQCSRDGPFPGGCITARFASVSCNNVNVKGFSDTLTIIFELSGIVTILALLMLSVLLVTVVCFYKKMKKGPVATAQPDTSDWTISPPQPRPPTYAEAQLHHDPAVTFNHTESLNIN